MELKELTSFGKEIDNILTIKSTDSHKEQVFTDLIKVQEELGELSEAVLGEYGKQREGKEYGKVGKEMADVILATMVLSSKMNIDLEQEIQNKIITIKERFNI